MTTTARRSGRSRPPTKRFPLTSRGDGRWCKKVRGKFYYFTGTKAEALAQWRDAEAQLAALETAPVVSQTRLVAIRRLSEIRPSPENDKIYGPVNPEAPDIKDLAADIADRGVLQKIIATLDGYILSGHRRYAAAKLAGLEEVECEIEPINRTDDIDAFTSLLVAHNQQRVKTFAQTMHEAATKIDGHAYTRMVRARAERSEVTIKAIDLGIRKGRAKISGAKRPMLDACLAILKKFNRPLSDRKIHYELLNAPPLRHAQKSSSRYRNDRKSYGDLCNLLTRARIAGIIPWESISDETRPVTTWNVWASPQTFIDKQLRGFLKGYFRDLTQSQPNHCEVLAEKNTVAAELKGVCGKYCLPMTSGRGFCSSRPRHDLYQRYKRSGKDKLVLLIVSDLDPAGMTIAESFARSMRDDFGIEDVHAVKVAITSAQVKQYKIPHGEKAKAGRGKKDSVRAEFVRRYGEYVYEVEALPAGELAKLLDKAIRSVIDLDAYNHELAAEHEDAKNVEGARLAARAHLQDLTLDDADDDEGGQQRE